MIALFVLLGVLPSLIWLSIYLREDDRPEPNSLIVRAFLVGALAAPLAAGSELLLSSFLNPLGLPQILASVIVFFVVIALVEEFWKYLVIRLTIVRTRDFDEPTDAMIYLIVAALGFAAVENILALFSFVGTSAGAASGAIEIIFLRFVSATLLHVLASAIVGYYVARKYFFRGRNRIVWGLAIASLLHGLYNVFTLSSGGFEKIVPTLLVIVLLGIMAIIVNILFYRLKKDFFQ